VTALSLATLASAGTAAADRAPVNTRAAVRTAMAHLLAGWHPANHGLGGHTSLGKGLKHSVSGNWSGYADDNSTSKTYSSVTGHWTEPKITGCKATALSAAVFWMGIDGFANRTVEQAGSAAICPGGRQHDPVYATWWEMFPSNSIRFIGTTVKPGDKISASVVRSGTRYTLKVTDSTMRGKQLLHHPDLLCHHVQERQRGVDRRGAVDIQRPGAPGHIRHLDPDERHREGRLHGRNDQDIP